MTLAGRASFRDPAGTVVDQNGVLTRIVSPAFVPMFRAAERVGLIDDLQRDELLVSHVELEQAPAGTLHLAPERVPFISYPYEWTPGQLRDAALLTLEIARRVFERGMALRDASAFNVQFLRGRPILIDTLSIGPRAPDSPWLAYGQFCRHFLAPLALAGLCAPELMRITECFSDGLPVQIASDTLGLRGRFRPGVALHLHLHALAERHAMRGARVARNRMTDRRHAQLIEGLRSTVESLTVRDVRTPWLQYEGGAHYNEADRRLKDNFVADAIDRVRPMALWDLGGNRGDLALAHAPVGGSAVVLDSDLGCVDACYRAAYRDRKPVVALWRDLLAPTAASGWAGEERASLTERGPADLVIALALVHHLCLTGQVPVERVSRWFRSLGRWAVVEVPDRNDPMVADLFRRAPEQGARYGRAEFRAALTADFEIVSELSLVELPRTLFLLRART
jgi:hypothetical protein